MCTIYSTDLNFVSNSSGALCQKLLVLEECLNRDSGTCNSFQVGCFAWCLIVLISFLPTPDG